MQMSTAMIGIGLSAVVSIVTWMFSVNAKLAVVLTNLNEMFYKIDDLAKSIQAMRNQQQRLEIQQQRLDATSDAQGQVIKRLENQMLN